MSKIYPTIFLLGAIVFFGLGCKEVEQALPLNAIEKYNTSVENNMTKISYYISPNGSEDKTKYCNGADMDSEGYKETLTKKVTVTAAGKLTGDVLINRTLNLAAQAAGFSPNPAETEDVVKVVNGTAEISPIEGWTGISIYLCAWKPFVEKNLEQFSEIQNIVWK